MIWCEGKRKEPLDGIGIRKDKSRSRSRFPSGHTNIMNCMSNSNATDFRIQKKKTKTVNTAVTGSRFNQPV